MTKKTLKINKDAFHELQGDSPRERLLHRLHSVALVLYGLSASEAGDIYGDSPRAVAYWVTRFKEKGIEGLEEEPRSGRPSKLTPLQIQKLQTFLKQTHAKSKIVSAAMLSKHIKEQFDVSLTRTQCWRILKRLAP
jgi:transposase